MRLAVTRPATAVVFLLLSASLGTAAAQPREKVPRVGYLTAGSHADQGRQRRFEAFRQGMRDLGYAEGQNIAIESRWAEGKDDRYPTLAADLVRLKVDVIVAVGGAASKAAQQATRTIPIVMSHSGRRDPFEAGDFIFVAAGTEHWFEDFTEYLAVWVVFYGPPGGEVPT